jgi:hypothetical protein
MRFTFRKTSPTLPEFNDEKNGGPGLIVPVNTRAFYSFF